VQCPTEVPLGITLPPLSIKVDNRVKRWAARCKSALMLEILQGLATVSKAARQFYLSPPTTSQGADRNSCESRLGDLREQYATKL
jgi:hypothetical protein